MTIVTEARTDIRDEDWYGHTRNGDGTPIDLPIAAVAYIDVPLRDILDLGRFYEGLDDKVIEDARAEAGLLEDEHADDTYFATYAAIGCPAPNTIRFIVRLMKDTP